MLYRIFIGLWLLFSSSFFSNSLYAKDNTLDIFSLSLRELMNVRVVSLSQEKITDSPAVVSTYSAAELKKLGLYSLKDFISFVPGVELIESVMDKSVIQIRGISDTANQKILFLLNGIPYWEPSHGSLPLLGIPISAIEKIEVIRGPGSVIHGTNASAGVINVITRGDFTDEVTVYAGSNDFYNANLYLSHVLNNGVQLALALETQRDDGYKADVSEAFNLFDPGCNCFPENLDGKLLRYEEQDSVLLSFKHGGLELLMQAFESTISNGADGSIISFVKHQDHGQLLHIGYKTTSDSVDWDFYSDWNRFYRELPIDNITGLSGLPGDGSIRFDHDGNDNVRWRNGVKARVKLNQNLNWLSGIEYEKREIENFRFYDGVGGANAALIGFSLEPDGSVLLIEADDQAEKSVFTQLDHSFGRYRLVAGARYVSNSESGSHLAPRGSVVYSLSDNSSLKLLYSEGFNSPVFRQTAAIDAVGFPTNADIDPEIIKTWDLAYTYTDQDTHFVINAYRTCLRDRIESEGGEFANNPDRIERVGLEIDYRRQYGHGELFAGYSYVDEGNDFISNDSAARFVSPWLLKAGATYGVGSHTWGFALRSSAKRGNVDAFHQLTLNYQFAADQWRVFAKVANALDDEIIYPDVRNEQNIKFQGSDSRSLLIGGTYQF